MRLKMKDTLNKKIEVEIKFLDDLKLQFTNSDNKCVYTFERTESPASNYGNKTCVVIKSNILNSRIDTVDTRYSALVIQDFKAWCIDYLDQILLPHIVLNVR